MSEETHIKKINRVIDFIQDNLDSKLKIKELSNIAFFSEFHFNRVFKEVMGESIYQYIRRIRLEKSAELLSSNLDKPVTEIALATGFSNPSSFAKAFKTHFGMSASDWRNKSGSKQLSLRSMAIVDGRVTWRLPWKNTERLVKVEDIPTLQVAYVRNIGPFQADEAVFKQGYDRLFRWAMLHDQIDENTFTINIYNDNPAVTQKKNLRMMTAIPVKAPIEPSGTIGIKSLLGGKYGVSRFLLKNDDYQPAWDWMLTEWLPCSGYKLADNAALERGWGEKVVNGDAFYQVDICIPIAGR